MVQGQPTPFEGALEDWWHLRMRRNWSQVARMFYEADFISSGRDSDLSRAMLPHEF